MEGIQNISKVQHMEKGDSYRHWDCSGGLLQGSETGFALMLLVVRF